MADSYSGGTHWGAGSGTITIAGGAPPDAWERADLGEMLAHFGPQAIYLESYQGTTLTRKAAAQVAPASLIPAEPVISNGIATVPVRGLLIPTDTPLSRFASVFFGGATIMPQLAATIDRLTSDHSVSGIILNIDSPGGAVTGVMEVMRAIESAREVKPVVTYIQGLSASGGYFLAGMAGAIVAEPTAIVGSIGVSWSERIDGNSNSVRTFRSGVSPRKNESAASADGAARVQAIVDDMAHELVTALARGRGVTFEHVVDNYGAGAILSARSAFAKGMIDHAGGFGVAVAIIEAARSQGRATISAKGVDMADMNTANTANQQELESLRAQVAALQAAAQQESTRQTAAVSAAVTAERQRVTDIISLATGRNQMAAALPFIAQGASVELATAVLQALPVTSAAAQANSAAASAAAFANAMNQAGNPNVGQAAEPAKDSAAAAAADLKEVARLARLMLGGTQSGGTQ